MAVKKFFSVKRPFYGLLLGDATYDYRDILGLHSLPGVPPFESGYDLDPTVYANERGGAGLLVCGFRWQRFFAGHVPGPNYRPHTRGIRGLLPQAGQPCETGERGFWCKRAILVSDDEFEGDPGRPDPIGLDHVTYCETVNSIFGAGFEATKVYLTEYPLVSIKDKPGARADLIAALRRGALLFCFFGHGSGDNLTHENALTILSVPQLANQGRSPFCFFGSCSVGRWDDTKAECIAEEMVRKPDGGSIASVGASKVNIVLRQPRLCPASLHVADRQSGPADRASICAGNPEWNSVSPVWRPGDDAGLSGQRRARDAGPRHTPLGSALPVRRFAALARRLCRVRAVRSEVAADVLLAQSRAQPRPVTYVLPGAEMFHGLSRVGENVYEGGFVVPTGTERRYRSVNDGSYIEIARSSRLSLAAGRGAGSLGFCATRSSSTRRPYPAATDGTCNQPVRRRPAAVRAGYQRRARRVHSDRPIVRHFRDSGQSGARWRRAAFYFNDFRNRVAVNQSFAYDLDSHTSGSFTSPVTAVAGVDSIVVTAADNFQNRSSARVLVQAQDNSKPEISEPLVYPNPVSDGSWFTFRLSTAAVVTVRVFSLSGRPLPQLRNPTPKPDSTGSSGTAATGPEFPCPTACTSTR